MFLLRRGTGRSPPRGRSSGLNTISSPRRRLRNGDRLLPRVQAVSPGEHLQHAPALLFARAGDGEAGADGERVRGDGQPQGEPEERVVCPAEGRGDDGEEEDGEEEDEGEEVG